MAYLQKTFLAVAAAGFLAMAGSAAATTITFDDLAIGTTLSNQYSGQGVTFSANAFSGAGGPTGNWATNTNLTIVSATGSDVGSLGTPSLVGGNLLRSFVGWLGENGDPSFLISFGSAVNSVNLDFAGVAIPSSTRLFVYNGAALLGVVTGSVKGQFTLGYSAASITSIGVTPGDFSDWVGVDNLTYTLAGGPVPEPATWGLMLVGFGGLGTVLRRRRVQVISA